MPSIASMVLDHYNGVRPITADDSIPFPPAPSPRKPKRQPMTPIVMTEQMLDVKEAIRSTLKDGVWVVNFTKVDGTLAVMECTLDPELLPNDPTKINPVAPTTGAASAAEHLLHVYAVDRQGWRSFVVPNVISIARKP